MKQQRSQRVAEAVRQEIAALLSKGIKDPRIGFVSVMEVRMSPDLRYANVYMSLYGSDKEKKSSLAGLRSSAGFIRREVSKRLKLRFAPEIRFFEDKTLEDVFHLENIFRELHEAEGRAAAANGNEAAAEGTGRGENEAPDRGGEGDDGSDERD